MKLFISTTEAGQGWTQASYGCSNDGNSYYVETYSLKGDEVPDVMNDAKTASQFVAGLLNAYFNNLNVVGMSAETICKMGEETNDPNQLKAF